MDFYVTVVAFWMTLLMNKRSNIVMDDKFHPLAKTLPLPMSATHDEILSWMIEFWMKNRFVRDGNCNTVNL